MDSTFDKLKTILVRDYKGDAETLTLETPLQDLGLDSLGTVEMLWTVEEEFGIQLPSEPVDLPDIAAVVAFIDALVAAQKPGNDGGSTPSTAASAKPATPVNPNAPVTSTTPVP
ncbi:Phosphopantetheine-binding protein [Burkholderiales bacterium 8X]|nr:Phosphopantetheine-binding protein [Burkholderiales bacterium 8X]